MLDIPSYTPTDQNVIKIQVEVLGWAGDISVMLA
jgi:hypothetical protein